MKQWLRISGLVALVVLLAAGCAGGPPARYSPSVDPADFVGIIDNPFLPMTPGAKMIYEGKTEEGLERIEVVVTGETREVMGVVCVVVRDTVWLDGDMIEDTYDWYAQDRDGNVWYFGEDSKEYRKGQVTSAAGSWEAGVDGALPGIIMKAGPTIGDTYRQEYYAGEAEDMAKVVALGRSVSVPAGSYTGCLKTLEWTPLEPGVAEFKYYAPGIGVVLEAPRGSRVRVELVEIIKP